MFKGVTEAMAALEGGNCVGVVFDTTFFAGIMGDAKWADYAMVLPSIDPEPWGMGVRKDDPKFAAYMSDVIKEWHKTGFLLGAREEVGHPAVAVPGRAAGEVQVAVRRDPARPAAAAGATLGPPGVDDVAAWFLWLHKATGIKLTIFYDAYDRARFVQGFLTTLKLSAYCLVLSLVLGAVAAWLQGSRDRGRARRASTAFVQLFRNTPPLVQLYFFYFALGPLLPKVDGMPLLGSFGWAVVSLTLLETAFAAEIFRAGIEAVPKAMVEAAQSLGFSRCADLPQGRAAAGGARDDAGDDQQPRQPGEDDDARLRDRGAGARLHVGAGLVGAGQRAGDDGRAAHLLRRDRRHHQPADAVARSAAARAGVRAMSEADGARSGFAVLPPLAVAHARRTTRPATARACAVGA